MKPLKENFKTRCIGFFDTKYCITNRMLNKINQTISHTYYKELTLEEYKYYVGEFYELKSKEPWLEDVANADFTSMSLKSFQNQFFSLYKKMENKFYEEVSSLNLIAQSFRHFLTHTLFRIQPNYDEFDEKIKRLFFLKLSLESYEIKNLSISEEEVIGEIQRKRGIKRIKSFPTPTKYPPMMLIEMLKSELGYTPKPFLGMEMKKGDMIVGKTLDKLIKAYGVNSAQTFDRTCTKYREEKIKDYLTKIFKSTEYENAILFLNAKIREGNEYFTIEILKELIKRYNEVVEKEKNEVEA